MMNDKLVYASKMKEQLSLCRFNCDERTVLFAIVNALPAVDAVEVVRCRDCEHGKEPGYVSRRYGEPGIKTCKNPKSMANRRIVMPYDFCPYGERRDDNADD